jgi:hypothetical protein
MIRVELFGAKTACSLAYIMTYLQKASSKMTTGYIFLVVGGSCAP